MSRLAGLLLACLLALNGGGAHAEVVRGEGHYTYYGLEGDTKPANAQAGDRFIETDNNGKEWSYSGSAWVETYVNTTAGTLVPCEVESINRCAVVFNDSCTRYTADATAIKTGAGTLSRVIIETLAATTDDFILYDNTAASGTVLLSLTNMPATSTIGPISVSYGGAFTTGLSLDVTLTAGSSIVVCLL